MPLSRRDPFTRLLRARPLLLASILFLIGCILQCTMGFAIVPMVLVLAVMLLLAICLRRRRAAAALLILAMLPLGALRFELAWSAVDPLPAQRNVQLTGRISETPVFNERTVRTVCVLEDIAFDGVPQSGKLRLYLRGDEELLREVLLGQRVAAAARIWQPDEATNPGQFSSAAYQRGLGLRNYATAEIETAEFSEPELGFKDLPERMRNASGERIDRLFPKNAAIARALILGDRSGLSSRERASYARAGAAHLLAISGMHMGILAGVLSLLLGRFLRRSTAFGVTVALLFGYGVLIGFTPSLTRALIMYFILGMAPIAGRRSDAFTRLGATMLGYLLIRPAAILDAGFVLSYGATAGILLLSGPLSRLPVLRSVLPMQPGFRLTRRQLLGWIAGTFAMTAAAQLAILPAVVQYFGAQPVWTLPTNLIGIPLTMLGYILALIATPLNLAPLAHVADFLFGLLTRLVAGIASLPLAELRIARFPVWLAVLCALTCFAASDMSRLPAKLRSLLPLALLLAIPVSNLCAWSTTLGMSVVFLDAGQADCAVIRSEGHVYLVDAGDTYSPAADYLSAMNYSPEAVFLTHPHADHAGGLADILEICPPKRIYVSAHWDDYEAAPELDEVIGAAREMDVEIVSVAAGDAIRLSEHATLRVLSPKEGILADSANDDSLLLQLEYGAARALFLADASAEVAAEVAEDIDLLKVAHHGARNGTDARLIAEISPSAAVISVGRDNSYGHPAARVLAMLEASGAQVFRTDVSGAVTCRLYEDGTLKLRGYRTSEDGYGLE